MRSSVKRLFTVLLAICVLLGSGILQAAAEEPGKVLGSETPSIQSPSNQNQENWGVHEDGTVHVLVMLDAPSVLESYGETESAAAVGYEEQLLSVQQSLVAQIHSLVGISESNVPDSWAPVWNLTKTCNAVSIKIPYGYLGAHSSIFGRIAQLSGVRDVLPVPGYIYRPLDGVSQIDGTDFSSVGSYSGDDQYYGAGMKIAFIDSGMDVNHAAFDEDAFLYALGPKGIRPERASQVDENMLNKLCAKQSNPDLLAEDTYVSEKIPFAFNYATGTPDVSYPTKELGMGTGVAGAAAANRYINLGNSFADASNDGGAVGIAPDAQIYALDVVNQIDGYNVYYWDDVMAAMEDAVKMQCDVINLNLDTVFSGFSYDHYDIWGVINPYMQELLNNISHTDTAVNVCSGNRGASISDTTRLDSFETNQVFQPGTAIDSLCVAASAGAGSATAENDEMADYSSWGIPSSLVLKPEIVAPGSVYTLSAGHKLGERDEYEWVNNSMISAGEMSGAMAVVGEYLETCEGFDALSRRAAAQSLLMSTAAPMMKDGRYYPVLQQGTGLMDLNAALSARTLLVMNSNDETLTAITGAAEDGKVKAELGDDFERTGEYSYSFRIYNLSNETVYFDSPYTDAFTQDYYYKYDSEGNVESGPYMSKNTTEAQRSYRYTWTPSPSQDPRPDHGPNMLFDINRDGGVNDLDARDLLDYLAGNLPGENLFLRNADFNRDGKITSFDAKIILDYLENEPTTYVPGGGYADVTIRFHFDVDDDIYTAGAFIEGYTHLTEKGGITHSIPILGYYGDWTEPDVFSSYERITYHKAAQGNNDGPKIGAAPSSPDMPDNDIFTADCFGFENIFSLNQNAAKVVGAIYMLDQPGGAETELLSIDYLHAAAQSIYYGALSIFDMVPYGLTKDTDVPLRFVFFAIPEYTALKYNYEHGICEPDGSYSASLSNSAALALYEEGYLKDGSVIKVELAEKDWFEYKPIIDSSDSDSNNADGDVVAVPEETPSVGTVIIPPTSDKLTDANVDLIQSVSSANGIIEVTFDPYKVVYKGISTELNYTAVHVDEENGVIRFVYADTEEIDEGALLASIRLGVRPCSTPEAATVTVCERGETYDLTETSTVDLPDTHCWTYAKVEWRKMLNSYRAFVLFRCEECGALRYVEMEIIDIQKLPLKTVYTAWLSAEKSLDGMEYTATYTAKLENARRKYPISPIIVPIDGIVKP